MRCLMQAKHSGKVVVRTCVASAAGTNAQGSAVVTGGLGSLGALVGSWLAQHTTHTIRLLGRTGRTPNTTPSDSSNLLNQVAAHTCVTLQAADMSTAYGHALVAVPLASPSNPRCRANSHSHSHSPLTGGKLANSPSPPLRTVMHAAGVLLDATLANQSPGTLRATGAPKVGAALGLYDRLVLAPVGGTVHFSSLAAMMGSAGQGNYVAANAGLDALARDAQLAGLAHASVQWGPWGGAGMAAQHASTAARAARMGFGMLTAQQARGPNDPLLTPSRTVNKP
eukprot:5578221-Pyramimonas_sp.AAC.1